MDIRTATQNDLYIIQSLLAAEYIEAGYSADEIQSLKDSGRDPESCALRAVAYEDSPDSTTRAWIAVCNGQAAGIITTKDISGGIYVEPDFRGRGIGHALLQARNAFLSETGQHIAQASVAADNDVSLKMHLSEGYCFTPDSQRLIDDITARGGAARDLRDEHGRPPVLVLEKPLIPDSDPKPAHPAPPLPGQQFS